MNLKNIREGIDIISKYYDDPEGYHTGADHDQFYRWETDRPVSDEDKARLDELGWMYEEGNSWSCFT